MHTCVNQRQTALLAMLRSLKGVGVRPSFWRWVRKEFRCRDCDMRKESRTEKSMAFPAEGTRPFWRKARKSQHLRNRAIIIHMRVNQSHMPLPAMLRTLKDVEVPPSLHISTKIVDSVAKREKTSTSMRLQHGDGATPQNIKSSTTSRSSCGASCVWLHVQRWSSIALVD